MLFAKSFEEGQHRTVAYEDFDLRAFRNQDRCRGLVGGDYFDSDRLFTLVFCKIVSSSSYGAIFFLLETHDRNKYDQSPRGLWCRAGFELIRFCAHLCSSLCTLPSPFRTGSISSGTARRTDVHNAYRTRTIAFYLGRAA